MKIIRKTFKSLFLERQKAYLLVCLKARSAIEAIIEHAKHDHGLARNYLLGTVEDKINAVLVGCAFNLRKMMRLLKIDPTAYEREDESNMVMLQYHEAAALKKDLETSKKPLNERDILLMRTIHQKRHKDDEYTRQRRSNANHEGNRVSCRSCVLL